MLPLDSLLASLSTFSLIALAELGDKSQLVCMTLASRHRHWPVILGAGLSTWIPEQLTAGLVAILFGAFGIHALRAQDEDNSEEVVDQSGHSIFFTTMLLIFVAEFGDKTQIAVAGLTSTLAPLPVWQGATIALALVSVLGVWIGRTVLQRLPLHWLRRFSGGLFILFALLAAGALFPCRVGVNMKFIHKRRMSVYRLHLVCTFYELGTHVTYR